MNNLLRKAGPACVALSSLVLLSPRLQCAEFPQAAAAAQVSLKQGFTRPALPVLVRSGSIGAEAATAALIEQLCGRSCSSVLRKDTTDAIVETGPTSFLEVSKDGSAGQFEDRDVFGRSHGQTKPLDQRMSQDALQQAGLNIIRTKLASVIHLQPNEQFIPISTSYRIEGGQSIRTGEKTEGVAANRVTFGRIIDGTPVVGGGSRVSITIANDGSLESLRYDWPTYTPVAAQTIVDKTEIFSRLEKVLAARTEPSTMKFTIAMPGSNAAYPLALTPDMKLQKLECGYYDPGLQARAAAAPVQTGCVYHVVKEGPNGMRRGFAGALPAGAAMEADAKWAELYLLRAVPPNTPSFVPAKAKQP